MCSVNGIDNVDDISIVNGIACIVQNNLATAY
jgi:hypothetical protein